MAKERSEIIAINSDDDVPDPDIDKPIIHLLKRLINNVNKQSTVLTNAQIAYILDKEFAIKLREIHELERLIYLIFMKKYLKDWPQWDEFDKTINILKTRNDQEAFEVMLECNYQNLKNYLKVELDRAQTLAKSTVNKMIEDKRTNAKIRNKEDIKDDDVVLKMFEATT